MSVLLKETRDSRFLEGPYRMPEAELGDVVYWHEGGVPGNAQPAIVTKVSQETLCLNIFDPSLLNMTIRDGVRHITDPRARSIEFQENGAWDHTRQTKRFFELAKLVESLQ